MLRKIILVLIVGIAAFFFFNGKKEKSVVVEPIRTMTTPTLHPSPTQNAQSNLKTIEVPYEKQILRIYIKPIANDAAITLIPNFSTKLSSSELVKKQTCDVAINGGFYTKEDEPLGLFTIGSKTYGAEISSRLVTGFLAYTDETLSITSVSPEESTFALQTGPLFTLPRSTPLSMVDDEFSRRSLIAEGEEGTFYTISMHDRDNLFSGPKLADVPVLLSIKKVQDEVPLTKALNLDGGSASFFYSKEDTIHLSELITIGSGLCIH